MAKEEKKRAKLKECGVDYHFPGYVCTCNYIIYICMYCLCNIYI